SGGGQRVVDLVGSHQRELHLRGLPSQVQGEGRSAGRSQVHVGGTHVRVLTGAVEDHARVGAGGHGAYPGVVGVEDGDTAAAGGVAARREGLDEFALGLGDGVAVAELTHVGAADVENDTDAGRGD